jgi:predicted RNase H-like HicB family nuclease
MKFSVIVHKDKKKGYWAEVPALPGCASQGESMLELRQNIKEAIQGYLCLAVPIHSTSNAKVIEVTV